MKASQLRDLTRRYAGGGIARDAYLTERKRLIDAITGGEETLKYRELDPPQNIQSGSSRGSRSRVMLAGGALLLVLVIAFFTHFLSNDNSPGTSAPVIQEESNEVVLALETFNARDDWSDQSLGTLEANWDTFTEIDRKDARSSLPYRRLKREVETRIKEHEALVAAGGDPDALMRAARLRMFSEKLGFTVD